MDVRFSKKTAQVLVVEPTVAKRQAFRDALGKLGFQSVTVASSVEDAWKFLEAETIDWVLTPLMAGERINALHLLKAAVEQASLRDVYVSLVLQENSECECLPVAYELGLLSHHKSMNDKQQIGRELDGLMRRFKRFKWRAPLLSSSFLREHLEESRRHKELLKLETELLKMYPGSSTVLLNLARAQALNHELETASRTLRQVELIDSTKEKIVEHVRSEFFDSDILEDPDDLSVPDEDIHNILGVDQCVLVDPDTTVHYAVERLLSQAGVQNFQAFDNPADAWKWLQANPEPGLILHEWKMDPDSGAVLTQRIRSHGFVNAPIVVLSSLVKCSDAPLLREMGVTDVLSKPFDYDTFFRTIVWAIQQNRNPTEKNALEFRIRSQLAHNNLDEAERLKAEYFQIPGIPEGDLDLIEAEFAFQRSEYEIAREWALSALEKSGDSLFIHDLLGKTLIKLGDFDSALMAFDKAHQISPQNIARTCFMAETHYDNGDEEKAMNLLDQAKRQDPQNERVQNADFVLTLDQGDTEKATSALKDASVAKRMIGYMNNRAIAYAHGSKFEEGLALYEEALKCVPQDWDVIRSIIGYNKGLAQARFGDLKGALTSLGEGSFPDERIRRKAESLKKRVETALHEGQALKLSSTTGALPQTAPVNETQSSATAPAETTQASGATQQRPPRVALRMRKGDRCCHLVYRPLPGTESVWAVQLLDNQPHFHSRDTIERDEALPQHSAKVS